MDEPREDFVKGASESSTRHRLEEWLNNVSGTLDKGKEHHQLSFLLRELDGTSICCWKNLCKSLLASKEIEAEQKEILQETLAHFRLWREFVSEQIIEHLSFNDEQTADVVLQSLCSIASLLLEIHNHSKLSPPNLEDKALWDRLRYLISRIRSVDIDDEGETSPFSDDFDLIDTISTLENFTTDLLELGPSIRKTYGENLRYYAANEIPETTSAIEIAVSGPASAFATLIRDRFPATDSSLIKHLAEANWQRSVRIRYMKGSRFCFSCKKEKSVNELQTCSQCRGILFCKNRCSECSEGACIETAHFSCWDLHLLNSQEHDGKESPTAEDIQTESLENKIEFVDVAQSYFAPATTFRDSGLGSSLPLKSQYAESFASTMSESTGSSARVPPAPKEVTLGTAFTCPYCHRLVENVHTRADWKRHVYYDLQPWICCHPDCRHKHVVFRTRKEWLDHNLFTHIEYKCPLCDFSHQKPSFWQCHLRDVHNQIFQSKTLEQSALKAASAETEYHVTNRECPFCGDKKNSTKDTFLRHISRHLESISLPSLPPRDDEESDSEQEAASDSDASNNSRKLTSPPEVDSSSKFPASNDTDGALTPKHTSLNSSLQPPPKQKELGQMTTPDQLNSTGDEYVSHATDEAGERKVLPTGHLIGGREYRCRTFLLPNRGATLFMLAIECARILNYRDSYLLFNKNRSLYKVIASQEEKNDLIQQEILPSSYRSRQIGIVTARSMFRQFGARIILNGHRVKDDYWETKARQQGFTEDDVVSEMRSDITKTDPLVVEDESKYRLHLHETEGQQKQEQSQLQPELQRHLIPPTSPLENDDSSINHIYQALIQRPNKTGEIAKIREIIQKMPASRLEQMRAQGIDPVDYYFRQQVTNSVRQHASHRAVAEDGSVRAEEIDVNSFLASLDPVLRQSVLREVDEDTLAQLSPEYAAEAREAQQQQLNHLSREEDAATNIRPQMQAEPGQQLPSINQIISTKEEATVTRRAMNRLTQELEQQQQNIQHARAEADQQAFMNKLAANNGGQLPANAHQLFMNYRQQQVVKARQQQQQQQQKRVSDEKGSMMIRDFLEQQQEALKSQEAGEEVVPASKNGPWQ